MSVKSRRFTAMLTLQIFICAATGCAAAPKADSPPVLESPAATSEPSPTPEPVSAADPYTAALFDGAEILDLDTGERFTLDGFLGRYDEFELSVREFSVLDMDGDELPEIALSLSAGEPPQYAEYLVLHSLGETVYAVSFPYRGFLDLKEDGTFERSGGAGDVAICSISFGEGAYSLDRITYCESYTEPDGAWGELYYVNHISATEEEYRAASDEWYESPKAWWSEFNARDVDIALHSIFPLQYALPVE
jgi:hypothetical protein